MSDDVFQITSASLGKNVHKAAAREPADAPATRFTRFIKA